MNKLPAGIRRTAIVAAASTLYLLPAVASPDSAPGPIGREFGIGAYVYRPAVAVDAAGDFVLAWQADHSNSPNLGQDIQAARYNAAGQFQVPVIAVNTSTALDQTDPAVASDAAGDFIVVWTHQFSATDTDIHGQRYSAAGQPMGSEFGIATTTANEASPSVAMDANGDFVVAWQINISGSYEIRAQRYNAAGVAQGTTIAVNLTTTGDQTHPAVALDAAGEFVIAWQSLVGSSFEIRYGRYQANGAPEQGLDLPVNTVTTGDQTNPAIAADAAGNLVVAWQSNASGSYAIRAQRFSQQGAAQGAEFAVDTVTTGDATDPAVATDAAGDFVVVWKKTSSSGGSEIHAHRYNALGQAQSAEFHVDSDINYDSADSPAIGLDADGDFVVAWDGRSKYGITQIRAQRYQGPDSVDVDLYQAVSADPAPVGSPLTYTLSVGNLQPPSTLTGVDAIDNAIGLATGLHVVDTLPAGSTAVSASGLNWTCTLPAGKVVCDYNQSLPAGTQASPIAVTLTPPGTPGAVIDNVGRVSADQFDDNLPNNRVVEHTQVVCAESVIALSASDYTVSEGTANAKITATRSGGACGVATVQYDTAGSSATPGLDFTDVTGTLTWADGDLANKTFNVPIINDGLNEIDERVLISLSSARGASLGTRNKARLTITDDDAAPRVNFTQSAQSVAESGGIVTVTARLDQISGRDVTVPLTFAGTASNGSDYFAPGSALTIPAGQMQASADIEIVDDATSEPDETIVVGMGAVQGATVGSISTDTITIADNDLPPAPTVSFDTAASNLSESKANTVLVQLSAASAQTVTVPYTHSGDATFTTDYSLSLPSPITFNPGETVKQIVITPVDDTIHESDEKVILTLGAPTNATLGTITTHQRTIKDNDP